MSIAVSSAIDTTVAIETPEHIVFAHRVAGPARRAVAHVIDLAICYGIVAAFALVVMITMLGQTKADLSDLGAAGKAGTGLVLVVLFIAQWVWFVVWEAMRGASPGKRWLGLRVLTTSGRPIGWQAAALRNLLRAADLLPVGYATGLVSMALTSRFQRLGDLVAGTMVVVPDSLFREADRSTRGAHAGHTVTSLAPPAHPKELASLPEEVTLDADEREAIEIFLRRRTALGRARENELAAMIAGPIGRRLGFRHEDPARLLALVYDRAVNAGRSEAPLSSPRGRRV